MTRRRLLGPGPALRQALSSTPPPQRRPLWLPELPEEPAVVGARLRADLLEAARVDLAVRAERVEEVDADELRERAVLARADGEDPAAAVDTAVREALSELRNWEADLVRLAAELVAAAPDLPLDPKARVRGRALDRKLERAHVALLAAVAEYHHGVSAAPERAPRPWWPVEDRPEPELTS